MKPHMNQPVQIQPGPVGVKGWLLAMIILFGAVSLVLGLSFIMALGRNGSMNIAAIILVPIVVVLGITSVVLTLLKKRLAKWVSIAMPVALTVMVIIASLLSHLTLQDRIATASGTWKKIYETQYANGPGLVGLIIVWTALVAVTAAIITYYLRSHRVRNTLVK
ncbi:MAG: hypothetical protein Q4A37_01505 [Candidatus Saccharibacteria bacterium]|nr:hypothetical protein [Candidatus Saccharibacteria bacterium]